MKRIKVYEGIAMNVFITDKPMPRPYELIGEFDNVPDAEKAVLDEYEYDGILDETLDNESMYSVSPDDDDWDLYRFNYFEYV